MRRGNRVHWRIWLAMLLAALALSFGSATALMLVVDDNNDPDSYGGNDSDYATITAAVADALSGDRILVCPGTYREQITIGSSI